MNDSPTPQIEIRWILDEYDCETCGASSAEGAIVSLDGKELFRLDPVAHCYNSTYHTEKDVYHRLLETLGYQVTEIPIP